MQTYGYSFPAAGSFRDEGSMMRYITELEKSLKDGPSCLGSYAIFPSDSAILDRVTLTTSGHLDVGSVNLHTYTELWEDQDDSGLRYLRECVEENIREVSGHYPSTGQDPGIAVTGDARVLGLEGGIPGKLYHITSRDSLRSIMEKGIIPDMGINSYKSREDYVYLCERKDIALWLAVLKHVDDPVILEVDTGCLPGLMPGRMFRDRSFAPDGYGEYRTKDTVPVSAIMDVGVNEELTIGLGSDMAGQFMLADPGHEEGEVRTGMARLVRMGIMDGNDVKAITSAPKIQSGSHDVSPFMDEGTDAVLTGLRNNGDAIDGFFCMNGEEPPWDGKAGEYFSRAVGQIPPAGSGMEL